MLLLKLAWRSRQTMLADFCRVGLDAPIFEAPVRIARICRDEKRWVIVGSRARAPPRGLSSINRRKGNGPTGGAGGARQTPNPTSEV